jgi:hypothetical protein
MNDEQASPKKVRISFHIFVAIPVPSNKTYIGSVW